MFFPEGQVAAAREKGSVPPTQLEMAERRLKAVESENARLVARNGALLEETAILKAWRDAGYGPVNTSANSEKNRPCALARSLTHTSTRECGSATTKRQLPEKNGRVNVKLFTVLMTER
jgi:hypothetical protein